MGLNFFSAVTVRIRTLSSVLLAVALALYIPTQVLAASVRTLEITYATGSYHVTFDVLLAAEPERVRVALRDYLQWPGLSDTLEEAELLKHFADGRQRLRLRFRSCVLVFCKTIRQVKDLTAGPDAEVLSVMVPEEGDFASGRERWLILAEQGKTRVLYTAEIVPSFGLPPLIGPLILKAELGSMLIETAKKLETLD
jgi:hypothetical protein